MILAAYILSKTELRKFLLTGLSILLLTSCSDVEFSKGPVGKIDGPNPLGNVLPVADFDVSCNQGGLCDFVSTSTDVDGSIVKQRWDFGSSQVNALDPTHQFQSSGTYPVTLTVTDNEGGEGSVTKDVSVTIIIIPVNQPPRAIFTKSCVFLECTFDATNSYDPDGNTLTYSWSLGGTSVIKNHTYASAGTYSVTLTVNDGNGGSDSVTKSVSVTAAPVNQDPVANFTKSCVFLACTFTSTSSDPDGDALTYSWSLGGTSAVKNHTYASAGTYSVTLTVNDGNGGSDSVTKSVTVTAAPENQAPMADFDVTCNDTTFVCNFTNRSSDPDGDSLTYVWEFGDSSANSVAKDPIHTYSTEGIYNVKLTATDGDLSDSMEKQVSVNKVIVLDPCDKTELITQKEILVFEADQNNCEWSQNENLSKSDGWIRARREQTQSISLPDRAILCDVKIDFNVGANVGDFFYDDLFIMTLDDVVLAAPNFLESRWDISDEGLPIYNWLSIRDQDSFVSNMSNGCLGEEMGLSSCHIPEHDSSFAKGALQMSFSSEIIQTVMSQDLERNNHDFKIIVTGDNDDSSTGNEMRDCRHSGVSFEVEAKYVIPAE